MALVNNLLSQKIISVIGWTLVHSLWQGALIALLGFFLLMMFRKSSANTRYLIGVSLLLLMFLMSMVTLQLVFQAEAASPAADRPILAGTSSSPDQAMQAVLWLRVKGFFNQGLPLLVTIWFLGALFFFLKFVSGILVNQHLRHHHTREVTEYWEKRLHALAARLHVRRRVVLRESIMARVPLTIGHLKPVILFPLGMLTQVPPSQVEALIVHELSHILRRDYLVNLLQNIMDILYFYHPGIRWISQQIRTEREHCCDDLTVSALGDRSAYARALTRIGESSLGASTHLAMAASGESFTLLNRIRRLYPMNTQKPRFKDGMISLVAMAAFALSLLVMFTASGQLFATADKKEVSSAEAKKETTKKAVVSTLQKRYQELATRKSSLSEEEKKEMETIALKLEALKRKDEEKKVLYIQTELEKLEAKTSRSTQEEQRMHKYIQVLKEHEQQKKLRYLKETYKKLKIREKELSAEEQKKLQAISEKLKAVEEREKERQSELIEKEKALRVDYEELKAREANLSKEEKARLKETALKLKEMQARAKEARLAHKEKNTALKAEYLRLVKMEKRTLEQEEKLKKIQHYMQELKVRYQELQEKQQALVQAIQAHESKGKLTKKEKHELQRLKRDLERVRQEMSEY